MRRHVVCLAVLVLLTACASTPPKPVITGNPPSGTWSGDYGPSPDQREQISVDLQWENAKLVGVVHAGARSLRVSQATFNPDSGAITIEFDTQGNGGQIVHYVIDGKVAGNVMAGTWTHDSLHGDFKVTKQ